MSFYRLTRGGLELTIKVRPASNRQGIEISAERMIVSVKSQAEKGKANEELIKLLSNKLHIPRDRVRILSGHFSRVKKLLIIGAEDKMVEELLSHSPFSQNRKTK